MHALAPWRLRPGSVSKNLMSTPNARPQPTKMQSFLQTFMIFITLFLAFNIYTQSQKARPADGLTRSDLATKLLADNAAVRDQTILRDTKPAYDSKIDADLKSGAIDANKATELKFQGDVVVADTELKGGIVAKDYGRLTAAFQSIDSLRKKYEKTELWNKPVTVTDVSRDPRFGWSSQSPNELWKKSMETLRDTNHKDAIWGFFPGYQFIDFLVGLTGRNPAFSYALAAIMLGLVVRLIIWPLSQKQLMFGRQMSQLTPLLKEIKEKHKETTVQQQKTMELYKEYGINPMAGCFPALIQMPLFLIVYQAMLRYRFEFQNGTFLWMNPHTSAASHGLTAPNLGQTDYPLIILYGITMMSSTLLTPVSDPTQKTQQRLMGIGITVLFTGSMLFGLYPVPAAFVLYWTCTNILASAQSIRAYRMPKPPLVKVNAKGGGIYPSAAVNGKALNGAVTILEETKTGAPAKHKPKKRK